MGQIWAIASRDYRSLFGSFIAYVVSAFFLFLAGFFFFTTIAFSRESSMRNALGNMAICFLFIVPIVTMRSFAEERKTGTIELLATSPLTTWQMVAGKFLGAWLFFGTMVVFSFYQPLLLQIFGTPDLRAVATGYLGFLLMGGALLSFGIFASSLTENQIISAMISFAGLLFLWICDWLSGFVGDILGSFFKYLAFVNHFQNFGKGVLDGVDAFYFLSFTGLFLFLTVLLFEAKK